MSTWHDGYHFLSKLTPRRLYNASQVLGSYYASRVSGKPHHRGMPISLSVEPTTACNLRCPQCPSGLRSFTRPTGKLTNALFQKVVDELQETLCYLLFYFQGEPFLHPQLLNWVAYASQRGIYTATSTNAHFLNDDTAPPNGGVRPGPAGDFHRRHYARNLRSLPGGRKTGKSD